MKTTSIKTIYLKEYELKQAIVEYLAKEHEELAQHLYDNECDMVWGQDGKEFLVSIDGEIKDEKENKEIDIKATTNKVIEDHKKTFYTCGIGLQHDPEIMLYKTIVGLKYHKSCWEECGIVKVSVTEDEWVEEQNLFIDKPLPWYGKCAHCFGGYVDQECTCEPVVSETTAICDGCGEKCVGERTTITTKNLSGVVMCEQCCGGNTTERVEEQAARLEKIAEQKEINKVVDQVESAAIKAVHKVMEQHSKTLDDHTPECKWHKDWHACDCGAFDK